MLGRNLTKSQSFFCDTENMPQYKAFETSQRCNFSKVSETIRIFNLHKVLGTLQENKVHVVNSSKNFLPFNLWNTPLTGKLFLNPDAPVYTPNKYIHLDFDPTIGSKSNNCLTVDVTLFTPRHHVDTTFNPVISRPVNIPLKPKILHRDCKMRKRIELSPSVFECGCICGHEQDIRDAVYYPIKKIIANRGVTIHPRTPAIDIKLQQSF